MDLNEMPKELEEIKQKELQAWVDNNTEQMALRAVDSLCTSIENGMDPDKAVELIFKFAHCAIDNVCHDTHDNWRKELKDFYYKEFIQSN